MNYINVTVRLKTGETLIGVAKDNWKEQLHERVDIVNPIAIHNNPNIGTWAENYLLYIQGNAISILGRDISFIDQTSDIGLEYYNEFKATHGFSKSLESDERSNDLTNIVPITNKYH